jgi:hypothetical protein
VKIKQYVKVFFFSLSERMSVVEYNDMIRKLYAVLIVGAVLVIAEPAYADTVGQRQTFIVDSQYDATGRTSLPATMRYGGDHANFYVDDSMWNQFSTSGQALFLQDLQALAHEFDTVIYPKEHDLFGSEPDIDKDSHVVVLLELLKRGTGGYFNPTNSYPRTQQPDSNERDMVAVNIEAVGNPLAKSFLAHEFQHLISLNQKEFLRNSSEEVWVNEMRAEYAHDYVGYDRPIAGSVMENRVATFLRNPSDSLAEWPNASQDYASALLFADYIAGRYGAGIIGDTLHAAASGIESFNQYLAGRNLSERFPDVFTDWMIANYINDSSQRFGYANPDLRFIHVRPQSAFVTTTTSPVMSVSVKDYQPIWQEFMMGPADVGTGQAAKLELSADPSQNFTIAYVLFYQDGTYDAERTTLAQGQRTVYLASGDVFGPAKLGDKPIAKVLVAVTKSQKTNGFSSNEPASDFTTRMSIVSKETVRASLGDPHVAFNSRAQVLRDGALIKRNNGEPETYVIWGKYRRYLSPEVIRLYGHLDPASAIAVDDVTFSSFTTSNYVRALDAKPVYAIWPDNTKHWLNITPAQWDATHRDWNAIFTISDAELNFYAKGAAITN